MTPAELVRIYGRYIDCLNRQEWQTLGQFVHDAVEYNGNRIGLGGYRAMLEADFQAIPDLFFNVALQVSQPPSIAARLLFDCTPTGRLFGLPVHGKCVRFAENVFYTFADGKIRSVWSVIDRAAIADQLEASA